MLVVAAFLVLLNGFFVAAEFAFVKVRATRIEQLVAEGNRRAVRVRQVLDNLDGYLSATQLGITLASLGLGWVGEPAFARLLEVPFRALSTWVPVLRSPVLVHTAAGTVAFAFITLLHVVLGELAPKTLAIVSSEQVALFCARPMQFFFWALRPFIAVLNGTSNLVLGLFGIQPAEAREMAHTDEEIRMLVSASARGGYLDETERVLLDNVLDFADRTAREIMVPRGDMVCLYVEDPIEESLETARKVGHTRFPLVKEEKDNVLGLIHIKDLFARQGQIQDLREIMRPILMVPETISVAKLLKEMQRRRIQMAILVDEYGGTSGLVTIEDILEEIVGEIQDEFDEVEEPEVEKLAPDVYEVDGAMLLEEAQDQFGFSVDNEPDVDTLGGYVFSQLGRQPQVGDRVDLPGYVAEVAETEGFRITRLKLTRKKEQGQGAPVAPPQEAS